jgi:dihydroorotate dehydrogenase (NAD+) catalytic subunit
MGLKIQNDLTVNLGKLKLQNPLISASGTFGYGHEVLDILEIEELEKIGAITTKTITLEERLGNPLPRILETSSGLLNSIGLQNIGLKRFEVEIIPKWNKIKTVKMIVSIGGNDINEYIEVCKILNKHERIDAFELNISCPNVKKGCMAIGNNPELINQLIKGCKALTNKPIIVKISPNFPNIKEIAQVIENSGADIICMVNTFLGTKIDIKTKKFYFANKVAGFSGPAIKPMALKLLLDIREVVKIPIIGMGGIANFEDVLEFMIAGANAVSIGTMNFRNPRIILDIEAELQKYCTLNEIIKIEDIVNSLETDI